jgi:hypothetical protein
MQHSLRYIDHYCAAGTKKTAFGRRNFDGSNHCVYSKQMQVLYPIHTAWKNRCDCDRFCKLELRWTSPVILRYLYYINPRLMFAYVYCTSVCARTDHVKLPKFKELFRRPRCRWDDEVKRVLNRNKNVEWIYLAQDRNRVLVNTQINLRLPTGGHYLPS